MKPSNITNQCMGGACTTAKSSKIAWLVSIVLASIVIVFICLWLPSIRAGRVSLIESEICKGNFYAWSQASSWIMSDVLTESEGTRLVRAARAYREKHDSVSAKNQAWRGKRRFVFSEVQSYCRLDSVTNGGLPFDTMLYPAFHNWPAEFFLIVPDLPPCGDRQDKSEQTILPECDSR